VAIKLSEAFGNTAHFGSVYKRVHLRAFIVKKSLPPIEIIEELFQRFRNYLLDNYRLLKTG